MKAFTINSIMAAACLFPTYSPSGPAAENKNQSAPMQTAAGIPKQDPQLIQGKLANGLTYYRRRLTEVLKSQESMRGKLTFFLR